MFIQLVTLTTTKVDEIEKIDVAWRLATAGRNTLLRERVFADRDRPNTYTSVCEFASYEEAMANSDLPETAQAAAAIAAVCDGPIVFGLLIEWSGHSLGADRRYCRQLANLELVGGRVARATVYCTGNWDAATYAQWTQEAGR